MSQDSNRSSRLGDTPHSDIERRRDHGQGPEGSTRLADSADTPFEQRRVRRRRGQQAVEARGDEFADALNLDPGHIEPVQLDDRGEQIGFVPDDRGRDLLGRRFAADRPFVEDDDVLVEADPTEGVRTVTDPGRRSTIADRARQQTAADADFVETDDLDADVGPGGVEAIQTRPGRRDDIADRARTGLAADDRFAEPGDFGVDVGPTGVEDAGFTDIGEQRRAGRQFADGTLLEEVGPDDIRRTNDGFGLTEPAERRLGARRFEDDLEQFDQGDLDPSTDVRDIDGGFGLARDPARRVAADRIDEQLPDIDVGPGDIELEETDAGRFEGSFEQEVRR